MYSLTYTLIIKYIIVMNLAIAHMSQMYKLDNNKTLYDNKIINRYILANQVLC